MSDEDEILRDDPKPGARCTFCGQPVNLDGKNWTAETQVVFDGYGEGVGGARFVRKKPGRLRHTHAVCGLPPELEGADQVGRPIASSGAVSEFSRGFAAARDVCIKWVADKCGTMNGHTMAADPATLDPSATILSQPAPVVKETPVPLNSAEDGARLDWLGEDLQRLEDVRERLEAMPDRTPLRYVIDLIRLEDAEQDEGARDL